MWLIVTFLATVIAATAFFILKERRQKLKLGLLTLMLGGTTVMVLVDHTIAFLDGEPFIQLTTDGLITSGTMLGIAMIIPIIAVWLIAIARTTKQTA
jgi:hypothetical protein